MFTSVYSSQPPAFLALVFPIHLLLGGSIQADRAAMVAFSVIGIVAAYRLGTLLESTWTGLAAASLLAVDPLSFRESVTLQADGPAIALALASLALISGRRPLPGRACAGSAGRSRRADVRGFSPQVSFVLGTTAWGWHIETGLHVLRLVLAGAFDRFSRLQVVVGHLGEALPFMLARAGSWLPPATTGLERTVPEYLRGHVHLTTSGFFSVPPFLNALLEMGADRILFSVDYPFSANREGRASSIRCRSARQTARRSRTATPRGCCDCDDYH